MSVVRKMNGCYKDEESTHIFSPNENIFITYEVENKEEIVIYYATESEEFMLIFPLDLHPLDGGYIITKEGDKLENAPVKIQDLLSKVLVALKE